MSCAAPRVMISATSSNVGKTTVSCGIMRALSRRGKRVRAFKSGPDYIDPMFHTRVIGVPSRNLDLFMGGDALAAHLVCEGSGDFDVTVIEGAMGFYDGISVGSDASAWALSVATDTPVVLVVDARGKARSIAAEVKGFLSLEKNSNIAGVIINRVSPMLYPRLAEVVEGECGVRVFGYLPKMESVLLESRHLGLVTADEISDLQERLDRIADQVERSVDLDALLVLADGAPAIEDDFPDVERVCALPGPRIAVARDEAFSFYYADSLHLLEELGAELAFFSPIHDHCLPEGASGLYIGGGYPELYAGELESNTAMLSSIASAISSGMPTIAECGGFMYLHERMQDSDGVEHRMVGAVEGLSFRTGRLGRFGYIDMTCSEDNMLASAGDVLRAHEFHYWDSDNSGSAFHARKPQSTREWDCVIAGPSLYAGYPHLYLPGAPTAARRFVKACARWEGTR